MTDDKNYVIGGEQGNEASRAMRRAIMLVGRMLETMA